MKNFWRRMAAREGFTLVELVVVIAILAILAAVAYPAYTGYIGKANEAADLTQLDGIKTAAQAAYATTGVTRIVVNVTNGKVSTITINTDTDTDITKNEAFQTLLGKNEAGVKAIEFKGDDYKSAKTITWESGKWTPAS